MGIIYWSKGIPESNWLAYFSLWTEGVSLVPTPNFVPSSPKALSFSPLRLAFRLLPWLIAIGAVSTLVYLNNHSSSSIGKLRADLSESQSYASSIERTAQELYRTILELESSIARSYKSIEQVEARNRELKARLDEISKLGGDLGEGLQGAAGTVEEFGGELEELRRWIEESRRGIQ